MKKPKAKADKKERSGYTTKLTVNGSFMDVLKASVKNANDKTPKK